MKYLKTYKNRYLKINKNSNYQSLFNFKHFFPLDLFNSLVKFVLFVYMRRRDVPKKAHREQVSLSLPHTQFSNRCCCCFMLFSGGKRRNFCIQQTHKTVRKFSSYPIASFLFSCCNRFVINESFHFLSVID